MRAENNKVEFTGTIITEPEFNHEVFGEGFYNMHLKVDRLSGTADIIPLIISERLINLNDKYTGTAVNVSGVYSSYNKHEEKRNRLLLYVFVCEIEKANTGEHTDLNKIQLPYRESFYLVERKIAPNCMIQANKFLLAQVFNYFAMLGVCLKTQFKFSGNQIRQVYERIRYLINCLATGYETMTGIASVLEWECKYIDKRFIGKTYEI